MMTRQTTQGHRHWEKTSWRLPSPPPSVSRYLAAHPPSWQGDEQNRPSPCPLILPPPFPLPHVRRPPLPRSTPPPRSPPPPPLSSTGGALTSIGSKLLLNNYYLDKTKKWRGKREENFAFKKLTKKIREMVHIDFLGGFCSDLYPTNSDRNSGHMS